MIVLSIKNSLTTDAKIKLRAFGNSYTFNNQYYGAAMFSIIVKMVPPDTRAECSDIKSNMDTMKISQFKHDIPRANLQIV